MEAQVDRVAVLLIVGRCEGMELIWLVTGVIVKMEGDIRILELNGGGRGD